MATFQVFTTYDMSNPPGLQADALSGVVSQNSATGFTVTYRTIGGSTQWVTAVTGSGFTYAQANGQLSVLGGTIASEVANDGTQNVYSLTGAAVDVVTDGNLSSGSAELTLWLAGGGIITGSSGNDSLVDYAGNHTLTGGGGTDRVIFSGITANYTITATSTGYTVRDNVGTGGTDTLNGIAFLKFSDGYYPSADRTINGTPGNETLTGGFGNDTISGGGGTDTVVFSGPRSNYSIAQTQAGYTVTDSSGVDGTDTLSNISSMQFTDQTITFVSQAIAGTSGDDTLTSNFGNDTIHGNGGRDTVVFAGPRSNYTISGNTSSWVVTDNVGLDGADTLFNIASLQFSDQTLPLASDLILTGAAGNDTITGGQGNDAIDGGAGSNTAAFSGSRLHYTVTNTAGGYTVKDNVGTDGTDTLSNIQELQFSDGKWNLSIGAAAASISPSQLDSLVQIYIAYFNRVPEASGLDYWIGQFKGGMSLNDIGNSFYVAALSFSSSTGYSNTMTDTDFINKIYQNVLGRSSPDQSGLEYWLAGLAPGGGQTRGSLVNTIIVAAHTYKGNADPSLSQVADLLDNKLAVGKYNAVTAAVDYLSLDSAITQGMAVSAAVTATDTSSAVNLIGLSSLVPFAG